MALAEAHAADLRTLYASLASDAPRVRPSPSQSSSARLEVDLDVRYVVDNANVGRRRLRNACLAYLAKLDGAAPLAKAHYDAAACLTDELAAAVALAGAETPERASVLAAFYDAAAAAGADLVVNKWFGLQAAADAPDALATAEKLVAHPAFSRTNPNRYRSVVNMFAAANPRAFHAADGGGYAFVRDEVLAADKINPQVAARLCGSFGQWRKYDAGRQALMRGCLEAIAATDGLSKDTLEIATRSLK